MKPTSEIKQDIQRDIDLCNKHIEKYERLIETGSDNAYLLYAILSELESRKDTLEWVMTLFGD